MTDTASPPGSRRWLMLPVVLLAMFMAGFDIWVVNVAAPSLQRDLHVSDAALQLIVGGYAFMYASGMVTRLWARATSTWSTGCAPTRTSVTPDPLDISALPVDGCLFPAEKDVAPG